MNKVDAQLWIQSIPLHGITLSISEQGHKSRNKLIACGNKTYSVVSGPHWDQSNSSKTVSTGENEREETQYFSDCFWLLETPSLGSRAFGIQDDMTD